MCLSTYTWFGDEHRVHELADGSLAVTPPTTKRAALVNADVGLASLRLGDVKSGISYGRRSLEAVRESETSFGLWRLKELGKALAGEPRARELRAGIKIARQAFASPH